MIEIPLTDFHVTRFGSAPNGLPSRTERRSFDYDGTEAVPEGLATEQQRRDSRIQRETMPGWRATIQAGGLVIAVVLFINIIILVFAKIKEPIKDAPVSEGNIALFFGDCDTANNIKTWSHIGINILGTLLLVTSGATMQVLSAPTRRDINEAHRRGKWLDIGLLSVRNLWHIPKIRTFLWFVLTASSVPLHLLYNSVLFSTVSGNSMVSMMVTADFANATWDPAYMTNLINQTAVQANGMYYTDGHMSSNYSGGSSYNSYGGNSDDDLTRSKAISNSIGKDDVSIATLTRAASSLQKAAQAGSLAQLSPSDCAKAFSPQIVSGYNGVLLVTTLQNKNSSVIDMSYTSIFGSPEWLCNDLNRSYKNTTSFLHACLGEPMANYPGDPHPKPPRPEVKTMQQSVALANPPQDGYFNLDHCLAQKIEGKCSVQLFPTLMIVVIVANIVKLFAIFYVARFLEFRPFVTVGDAVVDFMKDPDPRTVGAGPISMRDIKKDGKKLTKEMWRYECEIRYKMSQPQKYPPPYVIEVKSGDHERTWKSRRRFWYAAVSKTRWVFVMTLCFAGVITGGMMLALAGSQNGVSEAVKSGFGALDAGYILAGKFDSLGAVLLANTPQIIISNIYVFYNGLLTSMLLTAEWMDFAAKGKPMRVSPIRKGEQRSTYYLQLPYRYSIPLMAFMTTLHWMVSESFFLVHVDSYQVDGQLAVASKLDTIGYSASAIASSVAFAGLICLAPLILGFRRYPAGIPLVGNCSLAISAACHAMESEPEDATEKTLKYGVLPEVGPTGKPRVGFTSSEKVEPLKDGEIYDVSRCTKAVLLDGHQFACCSGFHAAPVGSPNPSIASTASTDSLLGKAPAVIHELPA